MKKVVYIAHPYTHPDPVVNTNKVIQIAEELIKLGFIPYIPHLTLFWHLVVPHSLDFWYEYDLSILEKCGHYLLRMGGESKGADGEVKFAKENNIPVYFSIEELIKMEGDN